MDFCLAPEIVRLAEQLDPVLCYPHNPDGRVFVSSTIG
jgi:hypothetical protein